MKTPALAFAAALVAASAAASTVAVNTTADTVANDGACSLREAVTAANTFAASGAAAGECGRALPPPYDRIEIPAGDYRLTRAGTGENGNANGDLDVRASVEIVGAGADVVTI
ncbi:MAG TPA: CSLREA domain-containing protein, partial [Tahibacter sp.]|nr:CSLREA domain-containing protein [Tahibacter sp.]